VIGQRVAQRQDPLPRGDSTGLRGSLLVMSVWILATFSILGVGVSRITSSQLALAKRVEERIVSQRAAEAALLHAMALRKADRTSSDTLQELGTSQERQLGRAAFRYTMVDENSRLSVNTASQAILARVPGFDLDAAVAITTSTLRPFHVIEELRALDEKISQEMLQRARPFLTVYGSGKVNINTAPPEVLQALGLDPGLVETILAFRAGDDKEPGTADDRAFESSGEIVNTLRRYTGLFVDQETALIQLISQGLLDVRSTAVTLQVETLFLGKPVSSYTIVLDTAQQKVKRWSER